MTIKFTTVDVKDGQNVADGKAVSPVIASHTGEENAAPERANEAADLLALNAGIGKRRMRKVSHTENKEGVLKVGVFQKPEEGLNPAIVVETKEPEAGSNQVERVSLGEGLSGEQESAPGETLAAVETKAMFIDKYSDAEVLEPLSRITDHSEECESIDLPKPQEAGVATLVANPAENEEIETADVVIGSAQDIGTELANTVAEPAEGGETELENTVIEPAEDSETELANTVTEPDQDGETESESTITEPAEGGGTEPANTVIESTEGGGTELADTVIEPTEGGGTEPADTVIELVEGSGTELVNTVIEPAKGSETEPADTVIEPAEGSGTELANTVTEPDQDGETESESIITEPAEGSETEPANTVIEPAESSEAEPANTVIEPAEGSEAELADTVIESAEGDETEPANTVIEPSEGDETEPANTVIEPAEGGGTELANTITEPAEGGETEPANTVAEPTKGSEMEENEEAVNGYEKSIPGLRSTRKIFVREEYQEDVDAPDLSGREFVVYNSEQVTKEEARMQLEERAVRKQKFRSNLNTSDLDDKEKKIFHALDKRGVPEGHIRIAISRMRTIGDDLSVVVKEFGLMTPNELAKVYAEISDQIKYVSERDCEDIVVDHACYQKFSSEVVLLDETTGAEGGKMDAYKGIVPFALREVEEKQPDGSVMKTTYCEVMIADPRKIGEVGNFVHPYQHKLNISTETAVNNLYRRFYAKTEKVIDQLIVQHRELTMNHKDVTQEAPNLVTDLLGNILRYACQNRVSDIYFHGTGSAVVIKLSVDGSSFVFRTISSALYEKMFTIMLLNLPFSDQQVRESVFKDAHLLFKDAAEARFRDVFSRYRFRMEVGYSKDEYTSVIRILDREAEVASLSSLNFDKTTLETLKRYIRTSTGLVAVTGPTGSGKTTTLYAMLKEIDPIHRTVETAENPVEYTHGMWMQYEVPANTDSAKEGEAWQNILKGLLRNAPKVILMGEVRDSGTASILMNASDTGHLVFTTLHTNTASSAIHRLFKLQVRPGDLANQLLGVIAQRLVRKVCPKCGIPPQDEKLHETVSVLKKYLPEEEVAKLNESNLRVARDGGCEHCNHMGYKGRHIVYEVLDNNNIVQQAIEKGSTVSEIGKVGLRPYYHMWHNGLRLVLSGVTSLDAVMAEVKPETWLVPEHEKTEDNTESAGR